VKLGEASTLTHVTLLRATEVFCSATYQFCYIEISVLTKIRYYGLVFAPHQMLNMNPKTRSMTFHVLVSTTYLKLRMVVQNMALG
jgi:hypothetical protein